MTGRRPRPDAPPGEFDLIARYFAPLARHPGALGLTDDAALLDPPPGRSLVLAADAMVAGVHFLPDDPPDSIARKLLRVNLSDLAAMGAEPLGYLLTIALPAALPAGWLGGFAAGLRQDQAAFGISLFGGDTVSTPGPITLSASFLGHVDPGRALLRSRAQAGQRVFVSGTIGDATLGLKVLRGELPRLGGGAAAHLVERYRLPEPRLALGRHLAALPRAVVGAVMDISDGLVADLGHICAASGIGAVIEAAAVPLSPAAREALEAEPDLLPALLGGGDDYEILFTAEPALAGRLASAGGEGEGPAVTPIGWIGTGSGVRVLRPDGSELRLPRAGWQHF